MDLTRSHWIRRRRWEVYCKYSSNYTVCTYYMYVHAIQSDVLQITSSFSLWRHQFITIHRSVDPIRNQYSVIFPLQRQHQRPKGNNPSGIDRQAHPRVGGRKSLASGGEGDCVRRRVELNDGMPGCKGPKS